MKAIIFHSDLPDKIALKEVEQPRVAGHDQCMVRIHAAALNRRDQWICEGLYPGIADGVTLGSDGCGTVVEGPDHWMDKDVIINPNIQWGENPDVQSEAYQILGMPANGTLSGLVVVPADRLQPRPPHLTREQAAALPLAGLTAYRACMSKAGIQAGHKVLVTGIGGGVAQFILQFCLAAGAEAYVTSSSELKIQQAINAGAQGGFNYRADDWVEAARNTGPFDAIIDSAGGSSVNDYLKIVKPAGKIVFYGSTTGPVPNLNMARLFWSQVQLIGSTMGNDTEFVEMLRFVSTHQIIPVIDQVYRVEEYKKAFARFGDPDHAGKIVISF